MAHNTPVLIKKNLAGIERTREIEVTITSYTTGGEPLTLGELGFRKIFSIVPTVESAGAALQFLAEWNGSKTAPTISLYTDGGSATGLAEVAAGALSPTVTVLLVIRGA